MVTQSPMTSALKGGDWDIGLEFGPQKETGKEDEGFAR